MPNLDGTGPMGEGPMTGRGLGRCSGSAPRGFGFRPIRGRGLGFRRGFGLGFRRRAFDNFDYAISREEEKRVLEDEKRLIEQRLKELENEQNPQ